jgi:hypothetical protein
MALILLDLTLDGLLVDTVGHGAGAGTGTR